MHAGGCVTFAHVPEIVKIIIDIGVFVCVQAFDRAGTELMTAIDTRRGASLSRPSLLDSPDTKLSQLLLTAVIAACCYPAHWLCAGLLAEQDSERRTELMTAIDTCCSASLCKPSLLDSLDTEPFTAVL